MLGVADGLISLLKNVELEPGVSFWEKTMIYCATDFGRSKKRNGINDTSFGSGHHLNNGVLAISPMLAGNKVLGGVKPTAVRPMASIRSAACRTRIATWMNKRSSPGSLRRWGSTPAAPACPIWQLWWAEAGIMPG